MRRPRRITVANPTESRKGQKIWMDGKWIDWADANVHVLSHAVHYGSGVFEGIRAYETSRGPAVWHLDEHLKRLFRSAKLYHMDIPFSIEAITDGIKDVIRANGLAACYIRPIVLRGYGEMGVNPLNAPVNVFRRRVARRTISPLCRMPIWKPA